MNEKDKEIELTGSDKYATNDPSKARYVSDIISDESMEILEKKKSGDYRYRHFTTDPRKARFISDLLD